MYRTGSIRFISDGTGALLAQFERGMTPAMTGAATGDDVAMRGSTVAGDRPKAGSAGQAGSGRLAERVEEAHPVSMTPSEARTNIRREAAFSGEI